MLHRIASTEARLFYAGPWYWKFQYLVQLYDFFLHLNDFWCSMICEEDYMLNAYSVSDITGRLSTIIQGQPGQGQPGLRDVQVSGHVEKHPADPQTVFWLTEGADNKIRCFLPGGQTTFARLLASGSTVVVKGQIRLYPSFSQYQIIVSGQPLEVNTSGNGSSSTVSQITGTLSDIIESQFQEVYIRGKISSLTQNSHGVFWHLHDVDSATKQINCVHFDAPNLIHHKIRLPNGNLVGEGDNICVGGYIRLWPARSRYQIRVTQVLQPDDGTAQCQCDGCSQCSQQGCSQPRRIPQYGSCSSCLPLPADELYELCPQCYGVSPDHEPKVEEAVYGYLSEINIHGFSPRKQHEIQFGSRNGIPDVVLVKGDDGTLAVVAECKGAGYVGHGIEQLKSYLSASDTRFGIFANRYDRSQWKFYENRRHNVFEPITRSRFEEGVRAEIVLRPRFELEIRALESQKAALEAEIADLHQEKQTLETRITELKIRSEEKKKKGLINWLKNLFSKENS